MRADEKAIGYVPYLKGELPNPLPATLVAFYLPQFHPIPENDEWWGKGFTEWRNVTRALPQFEGHVQPRLPGDLGFYDLRDPEVMREQARLAHEYGIGAFCFYFYWFGGKTLLEKPLRNWLTDTSIDFPFCLCWANEKWTRSWDGRGSEILIDQHHSPEDDLAFIKHVSEYLRDPRYLRVDGKPILLIYRPGSFPNMAETAKRWRSWCIQHGIGEIHLAYVQSFERPHPRSIGFDAAIKFPPNLHATASVSDQQRLINREYDGHVLDWREMRRVQGAREIPGYELYPSVNPGWDNEPRRPGTGRSYAYSSPRGYRDWLVDSIMLQTGEQTKSNNLVFINAWNEWAEGAILEPDVRFGYAWLAATRKALVTAAAREWPRAPTSLPAMKAISVVIHAWYLDVLSEMLSTLKAASAQWNFIITTSHDKKQEVLKLLATHELTAQVFAFDNRGRDILPFLHVANLLLDRGEDIVLKLHTKKSLHREGGSQWREELLSDLATGAAAQSAVTAFESDPALGMIVSSRHFKNVQDFLGGNMDNVLYLLTRLGSIDINPATEKFPAGSMFWIRLNALRPLLDAHLGESEFERESGQIDGTMAHAVERVFASIVRISKHTIAGVPAH